MNLKNSSKAVVEKQLQDCLRVLNFSIPTNEYELVSCFINHFYGTLNRVFHDVNHDLKVGKGCRPLGAIEGLMHDTVYLQVSRAPT